MRSDNSSFGNGLSTYQACLPSDSSVPTRTVRNKGLLPQRRTEGRFGFLPEVIRPTNEEEHRAWVLWQTGHLHLFVYWILVADACHQASKAISVGDPGRATRWIHRAAMLRWGEIAATYYSVSFSQQIYKLFLRPSMEAVRSDFAGRSARDYLALLLAIMDLNRMVQNIRKDRQVVLNAHEEFTHSCDSWWKHHQVLVKKLAPEKSLFLKSYERKVKEEGMTLTKEQYSEHVIQAPEALNDYDRYFGVVRKDMTLEEFDVVIIEIMEQVHTNAHLPPEQFRWLMRGDNLILTIIEERIMGSSGIAA